MIANANEGLSLTIGNTVIDQHYNSVNLNDIGKNKIIMLYFTGSWCKPCNKAKEVLINFYNKVNETSKVFEIIQVASEKNESDFRMSIESLPWLFIPKEEKIGRELFSKFQISTIPNYVILNKTGNHLIEFDKESIFEINPKSFDRWLILEKNFKEEQKEKMKKREITDESFSD